MNLQFEQPFKGQRSVGLSSPQSSTYVLQRGDVTGGPVFYAESVSVTREVLPGRSVDVAVEVVNERNTVTPLNPDYCDTGGFVSPDGLEATVTVNPLWTSESDTQSVCVGPGGLLSPGRESLSFSYVAPEEAGSYPVDVTVESDTGGGTERFTVQVTEAAPPGREPPEGGENGGEEDEESGGIDIPGFDVPLVSDLQALGGVVGLLLLLYLLIATG